MWRAPFLILGILLFLIATGCSRKGLECDAAKEPLCMWLVAPTPPMEIQPEIGDMIAEDEWRAAQTIEERKVLMGRAWASRQKELSKGFAHVKARVMARITEATEEAKAHPEKKLEIFERTEREIRATTFGPATAALPIDEWVEMLKHELGMD